MAVKKKDVQDIVKAIGGKKLGHSNTLCDAFATCFER